MVAPLTILPRSSPCRLRIARRRACSGRLLPPSLPGEKATARCYQTGQASANVGGGHRCGRWSDPAAGDRRPDREDRLTSRGKGILLITDICQPASTVSKKDTAEAKGAGCKSASGVYIRIRGTGKEGCLNGSGEVRREHHIGFSQCHVEFVTVRPDVCADDLTRVCVDYEGAECAGVRS
jgi:hypothetical protein